MPALSHQLYKLVKMFRTCLNLLFLPSLMTIQVLTWPLFFYYISISQAFTNSPTVNFYLGKVRAAMILRFAFIS